MGNDSSRDSWSYYLSRDVHMNVTWFFLLGTGLDADGECRGCGWVVCGQTHQSMHSHRIGEGGKRGEGRAYGLCTLSV